MGVNTGRAEKTKQRILDVLETEQNRGTGGDTPIAEVARKVGMTPASVSNYLRGLWKEGRVLRRHAGRGSWTYRFVRIGESIEHHKKPRMMWDLQAYDG